MDTRCTKCQYGTVAGGCDYILITGHSRQCKPGEDCDKFKPTWSITVKRDEKIKALPDGCYQSKKKLIEEKYELYESKFRELYNKGYTDRKIEAETGFSKGACARWRRRNGLPINTPSFVSESMKVAQARKNLWENGYTDREIAEELGESVGTVTAWRNRVGLKVNSAIHHQNNKVITSEIDAKFMELYNAGLCDVQIERELGFSHGTAYNWRKRKDLPVNPFSREDKEKTDERMRLYNRGFTDNEIAEITHVTLDAIYKWRRKRGMPPNSPKQKIQ